MAKEKKLETMEGIISSINHACTLAQNLLDLPNLANEPATLSLSIGEIVKTLNDTKQRLMILSQHGHTSKPSFAHEIVHQPQMDATSMQEWVSSSYTQTMDQLVQGVRNTIPDDERTLPETNMMGKEAMEALPSRSRKSRKVDIEKRTTLVPAPQFGNTEIPPEDGFTWRKYGQKEILGYKYPRCYYRCTHQKLYGCSAKKQVQRLDENSSIYEVTYRGNHTCHMSSTAPLSVPPQHLLALDMTQSTISSHLSPTSASDSGWWLSSMSLSLQQRGCGGGGLAPAAADAGGGPSISRYGADYPVVDMADAMFNSGSSSGNSMESLFPPTDRDK